MIRNSHTALHYSNAYIHSKIHLFTIAGRRTMLDPFQARSQNCKKRLLSSSCLSVYPSAWISGPDGKIVIKSDNRYFTWTFTIILRWILLRMRNVSHKSCTESQNTHFMFNNFFPKVVPFMRQCGKTWKNQTGHIRQNGACAMCVG